MLASLLEEALLAIRKMDMVLRLMSANTRFRAREVEKKLVYRQNLLD